MIQSPDKNSYCISANTMKLISALPQQLGHKSDQIIKRSRVILVSSYEQTLLIDFESQILCTKIQPQSFLSSGAVFKCFTI